MICFNRSFVLHSCCFSFPLSRFPCVMLLLVWGGTPLLLSSAPHPLLSYFSRWYYATGPHLDLSCVSPRGTRAHLVNIRTLPLMVISDVRDDIRPLLLPLLCIHAQTHSPSTTVPIHTTCLCTEKTSDAKNANYSCEKGRKRLTSARPRSAGPAPRACRAWRVPREGPPRARPRASPPGCRMSDPPRPL